jgi:signal transduction histidine kinase
MQKPTIPLNEKERLAALREYHILDSGAGKEFEELTQLASEICQTPISLVTLIDEDKQWFKAGIDLPVSEISRDIALCSHAIIHPFDPFVVPDLRKDKRFSDHPFVTGEPHVVFYASIPLTNPDGYPLGTLCVFDKKPKTLSENQLRSLKILAKQVVQLLELRKANFQLKTLKENLESRNEELQQFAYVVSHDIKSPLSSIVLSSEMLRENFGDTIDEENDQLLSVLNRASVKIKNLVDGILAYYRAEMAVSEGAEAFQLQPFLLSIVEMIKVSHDSEIIFPQGETGIFMNKTALEQIMVNLLQNALKYNDKDKPRVDIAYSEDEENYYFSVKDNGRGISLKEKEKIFELFTTLDTRDRFGIKGTGIGLSIVKKLVDKMSGKITIQSFPGKGSEFSFSVKKQMGQPNIRPYS